MPVLFFSFVRCCSFYCSSNVRFCHSPISAYSCIPISNACIILIKHWDQWLCWMVSYQVYWVFSKVTFKWFAHQRQNNGSSVVFSKIIHLLSFVWEITQHQVKRRENSDPLHIDIVDGHFGYCLFCQNFYETGDNWQSSIQPWLEWYSTCPCFQNRSTSCQNLPESILRS